MQRARHYKFLPVDPEPEHTCRLLKVIQRNEYEAMAEQGASAVNENNQQRAIRDYC